MTKDELVKRIAGKTKLSERDVVLAINAFTELVKKEVASGNPVYLRKFGSFEPKKRAAKVARDISRGLNLPIAACYIPSFKPSAEFKAEVKNKLQNK